MSIVQWNCRGILANNEQLKTLFRDSGAKIICLQETKLGDRTYNPGLDYSFYSSPPLQGERAQGGTGFIIHKSIKHNSIPINTALQACAVQIYNEKKITLCSLYLEPRLENHLLDMNGNTRQLSLDDLQNLINQLPTPFLLMGDFNAKHTIWGSSECSRWGNLVEQLVDTNDIILMNDKSPTRYDVHHNTSSAIDLSICSSSIALDYNWSVDKNLYGSDHWPIHIKCVHNNPSPCHPKWKIEEADWSSFEKSSLIENNYDDFPLPLDAYEHLSNKLKTSANDNIPKTTGLPRRPVVPWWNKKCAVARKITRTCFRRYLRSPCEVNKIAYARASAKLKRTIKKAKRLSWMRYISEISAKTPTNQIWKKIKKLQGKFVPNPLPVLKIADKYVSNHKEVAELLGKHFAGVSSASRYSPEFQQIRNSVVVDAPNLNNNEVYNAPFTMEEMMNALNDSKLTSPGEDGIRYEMIKHLPEATKLFLLKTYNGLWESHTSPHSWKVSEIIPGLKPGKNPELAQSYRPIALTSCVCKLFERMVNNRLVWFLESKNLLSNRQFGFRKNKSTLDPLQMLSREIQNAFAIQNEVVGVFFDLEKAYDTTWRGGILSQLSSWGIGGNMFLFIKEFLTDRYIKVRVGSEHSSLYLQEEGVPQGSVLSVTLFAVAINSLMENIPAGIQGTLFVDDFAIYCTASSAVEGCRKIQVAINEASKWAEGRGFRFSPQKTKAIRFTRKRRAEVVPTLFLNDNILPYEEEVKFLGVIFDKSLTFASHINDLKNRVKQSLNILKVVSHFEWGADRKTLLRLYTTLCLSKLDYACQVYGSASKTNLAKLDTVHNLGLRICTGAYRTSPVASLHVDAGLPPLSLRREELSLRYISKSLTSKSNPNYKYIRAPLDRAPNKPKLPKPLEVRLKEDIRNVGILSTPIAPFSFPKVPPWCKSPSEICLKSGGKKNSSNEEIKTKFLEHANKHNGYSLYTDGAKTSEGVGCAVVAESLIIKKKLPPLCSIFTAEMFAVLQAVKHVFNVGKFDESFIIFCDSTSVLLSMKQFMPLHPIVQEVQEWLVLLHSRKRIKLSFCWVPAHVGVRGNELADKAAKEAIHLQSCSLLDIPYGDLKVDISRYMRNKWQTMWDGLTDNLKLKAIRPLVKKWQSSNHPDRRSSIILSRLRIGHTHLTHNFLLKSGEDRQVPLCNVCRVNLSVKHILIECPGFNHERRTTVLHDRALSDVLDDDCDVESLMSFLKKIDLYYQI